MKAHPAMLTAGVIAGILALGSSSEANIYQVMNLNNHGANSLRSAIDLANANPGPDSIDLRTAPAGTIPLSSALPTISGETTIIGDGTVTISGFDLYRILDIDTSLVTSFNMEIEGVVFERGRGASGGVERDEWGGAIRCQGDIDFTITDCLFRNNSAAYLGGAVTSYSTGLIVENCSFIDNSSDFIGGALVTGAGTIIRNSTFSGNVAQDGAGGATVHFGSGSVAYNQTTVTNNRATETTGGVYFANGPGTVHNTVITENWIGGNESNVAMDTGTTVTYTGANFTTGGDAKLGPLGLYNHAYLQTHNLAPGSPLRDATVVTAGAPEDQRGVARPQNGATDIGAFEAVVYAVTRTGFGSDSGVGSLRDGILSGADYLDLNGAFGEIELQSPLPEPSGLVIDGPGFGRVEISAVSNDYVISVDNEPPVIIEGLRFGPDNDLEGGSVGISVDDSALWVIDCHFKDFLATLAPAAIFASDSELRIDGCCFTGCEAWNGFGVVLARDCNTLIRNSTFSDNQARQGGDGGAIVLSQTTFASPVSVDINHCTFFDNSAEGNGGHILVTGDGTFASARLRNSILIAGSAGGLGPSVYDPAGELVQSSNFGASTASGVMEAELADHGGPTPVHALLRTSLAVDNALDGVPPRTDQRGVRREEQGCHPDIGAYELIGNPYLAYKAKYFGTSYLGALLILAGSPWDDFADPDFDGVNTVTEFLLRMNPNLYDPHLQPKFTPRIDGFFTYGGITFRENHDAIGAVGYQVQRSPDLRSWESAGMERSPFHIIHDGYNSVSYSSNILMGGLLGRDREHYRVRGAPPLLFSQLCRVRDAGNSADPATGRGAVADDFQIGRYEVTNTEYTTFLNAVDPLGLDPLDLYNLDQLNHSDSGILYTANPPAGEEYYSVRPGYAELPVVLVDYWDAARYANWMHNGASSLSSTESGAYTLLGGTPVPTNANDLTGRNPGAKFFLPNTDEWYKAAYHTGSGNYSLYPMGGGTANNDPAPGDGDTANYSSSGAVPVASFTTNNNRYGAHVMGGNVDEFIEKSATGDSVLNIGGRYSASESLLQSTSWSSVTSGTNVRFIVTGFRIASALN